MATIELKNISKRFSTEVQAVDNISFKVEDSEFVVLVGPSGCGKTTLLRMISGLEPITSGEVLFDNIVVNDIDPAKRNVGMVFQEYALYPHLSVFENIAFPLKVLKRNTKEKIDKKTIHNRVLEVVGLLELTNLIKRKPKELSGGQRQRVALGRALVRKPCLFLFDEPLSNLDAKLRITLRQEIINLHNKLGITSIYVTHDQTEAMTMGDKIAVIKDGLLQQYDTPYKIYNNPKNLFVADFIGSPSINIFEGKIVEGFFVENNSNIKFKINTDNRNIKYVAIRPELINICDSSDNDNENKINVYVDNVEFIGNESIIYFTTGNSQKRIICQPTLTIKRGTQLNCTFCSNSLLLFDKYENRTI